MELKLEVVIRTKLVHYLLVLRQSVETFDGLEYSVDNFRFFRFRGWDGWSAAGIQFPTRLEKRKTTEVQTDCQRLENGKKGRKIYKKN